MPARTQLLDVPVDAATLTEVLTRCAEWLHGDRLRQVITANPELVLAARDPVMAEVFRQADLVVPDGAGLLWASRYRGTPLPERITGSGLVEALASLAAREGKGVALVGGRGGVAGTVARALAARHPRLTVIAAGDGALPDDPAVWESLERTQPALVFVAYGSPTQEQWIAANRERLERAGVRVAVGVGGAFDMLAGRLPRAPRWMRAARLEWLWRLILEPWRLPRILRAVVIFPLRVLASRTVFARRE